VETKRRRNLPLDRRWNRRLSKASSKPPSGFPLPYNLTDLFIRTSSTKSKSKLRATLSKAAHALYPSHAKKGSDALAGSEEEFAEMKRREVEEQKRKEEYEAYNLGKKGLGKGSMQMGG
jgi:hypothetical protein